MKLLLIETTEYAPVSPLFSESCNDMHLDWELCDEDSRIFWQSRLIRQVQRMQPDVILVVKGNLMDVSLLRILRRITPAHLCCYQTDDPWNMQACRIHILNCIPFYDSYITCKTAILDDLKRVGAQQIAYVPVAYKPSIHFPESVEQTDDVCLIGGADDERIRIVHHLLDAMPKLKLSLYGGYWDKEPRLRPYDRGIVYGKDFRLAIGKAKVCLNLLRSANRDQHNMRTFEIPACGGVQLTQRTDEHVKLGLDGMQFYESERDLVPKLKTLLSTPLVQSYRTLSQRSVAPHTWTARLKEILSWILRS